MNLVSLKRWAGVLGLLLLTVSAFGQKPAAESPINLKMRQRDARLNVPVTMSADRIYLGELLEALSAKTGVTLSMDNADSFSGILIACDLKQKPLADVMNSLWSLVGSKSGGWEWTADARPSAIRYSFRPSLNARNMAERLQKEMQGRFEAQAELLTRMAFMSPEERRAHIEDLRALRGTQEVMQAQMANEEIWTGMKLFGTVLSADQRSRVLNGEKVDISLASLPQEQRQAALTLEKGSLDGDGAAGVQAQKDPAETISFGGNLDFLGKGSHKSLMIMIGLASKQHSSSQGNFGFNADLQAPNIFADWILPGDVRKLEVETRSIVVLPAFLPEEVWNKVPVLDHNIAAAATVEGVSFMAVVPEHPIGGDVPMITPGKTPEQYFSAMWEGRMLMHKWRDGILLTHYPQWYYGDDAMYSYGRVKRLRAGLQKQDGLLSLADVAEPLTTLDAAQLGHLTEEFPFSGEQINVTNDMRAMTRTALCAFYQRYPKALSELGLFIDLKMRAFFQDPNLWPKWLKVDDDVIAVRIVDASNRPGADRRHTYTLQMTTSTQERRDVASFDVVPIVPKAQP